MKKLVIEKMSEIRRNSELESVGKEIVKNGEYAVLILCGGQASRFGLEPNMSKGQVDVPLGKYQENIFRIFMKQLKDYVPVILMTSKANSISIQEFFKENNFFDYEKDLVFFVEQTEDEVLDLEGRKLRRDGKIVKSPNGHGGVYTTLYKSGLIEKLEQNYGIKRMLITNIDNIGCELIDFAFIGCSQNYDIVGKTVKKLYAGEKVGVFQEKEGKLYVKEYDEISSEDNESLNWANINVFILSIQFLKNAAKIKLPKHYQKKRMFGQMVQKPETRLFDCFNIAGESWKIVEVKREEEFIPIKNKEGKIDSLYTAGTLYLKKKIKYLNECLKALKNNNENI